MLIVVAVLLRSTSSESEVAANEIATELMDDIFQGNTNSSTGTNAAAFLHKTLTVADVSAPAMPIATLHASLLPAEHDWISCNSHPHPSHPCGTGDNGCGGCGWERARVRVHSYPLAAPNFLLSQQ